MDRSQSGDVSDNHMETSEPASLEAVELEFALGAQDVLTDGFDVALTKAADVVRGRVLFNMPAVDTTTAQRIAAIAIFNDISEQVLFVTLHNDGITMSLNPLTGENKVFEGLGRNFAAVARGLDGL
ncbi:hypothetical protein ACI0FM_04935 [Paenochrobactrum sp. BZR 588]|uniref:hypothetical protein n=1 Tax=Paenochrobactrum TaxID=999488 RepID=UPI0035BC8CB6